MSIDIFPVFYLSPQYQCAIMKSVDVRLILVMILKYKEISNHCGVPQKLSVAGQLYFKYKQTNS